MIAMNCRISVRGVFIFMYFISLFNRPIFRQTWGTSLVKIKSWECTQAIYKLKIIIPLFVSIFSICVLGSLLCELSQRGTRIIQFQRSPFGSLCQKLRPQRSAFQNRRYRTSSVSAQETTASAAGATQEVRHIMIAL